MYTTQKAISKYSNKLILAPIAVGIGLITLFINLDFNKGFFQNIGNVIHGLIMVFLGVILFKIFNKKIKEVKGTYFTFLEDGFKFKTNGNKEHILVTDLKSAKKSIDFLEVTKTNNETIKIRLDDYFLQFEESQKLTKEIETLNKRINL